MITEAVASGAVDTIPGRNLAAAHAVVIDVVNVRIGRIGRVIGRDSHLLLLCIDGAEGPGAYTTGARYRASDTPSMQKRSARINRRNIGRVRREPKQKDGNDA